MKLGVRARVDPQKLKQGMSGREEVAVRESEGGLDASGMS